MRVLFFFLFFSPLFVFAENKYFSTPINQVLVHSSLMGQCMALTDVDLSTELPGCSQGWVTFDCGAELPDSTRINSWEKFNVAQNALITERQVLLGVTNDQSINGFCFAFRVDLK